jgi:hypothetical protein
MMVGVAHFCGEPEEDEADLDEEELLLSSSSLLQHHNHHAQDSSTLESGGNGASASSFSSPSRRRREHALHAAATGGPLSPGRGGGMGVMQRTISMGRRKTLMETYREVGG